MPGVLCADYQIVSAILKTANSPNASTLALTLNNTGHADLMILSISVDNNNSVDVQNIPKIPAGTTTNLLIQLPSTLYIVAHQNYSVTVVAVAMTTQGNATLPRQITIVAQ